MHSQFIRFGTALIATALALGTPERADARQGQATPTTPTPTPAAAPSDLPVVTRVLVVESSLRSIRSALFVDPIEHALATGTFVVPTDGTVVPAPDATSADVGGTGEPKPAVERTWHWLDAKKEATKPDAPSDASDPGTRPVIPSGPARFEDGALMGGYALVTVESPTRRVVMLDASGHRHVYVSVTTASGGLTWEPRVGDVYESGLVRVPIVLEAGKTHLLFRAGRGGLTIGFSKPPADVFVEDRNATLPTLLTDEPGIGSYVGGVVVVNATEQWKRGLTIRTDYVMQGERVGDVPALAPLSVTKVPVEIAPHGFELRPGGKPTLTVELREGGKPVFSRDFKVEEKSRRERHTRTFVSGIDGSVQYFAVVPPAEPSANLPTTPLPGVPAAKPALILSLHGASVEATGQAAAYASKDWAYIVCPTNRRPYGFDWEDWGRLDAMEVLDIAEKLFGTDPRRTYLTGHSMGGHGTWQLAVTYPGRWAAIAPSAGWPDFWAYTGAGEWPGDDSVQAALRRASAASRTLELVNRLNDTPIYILHGDKDDNVPVTMARLMKEKLSEHPDLVYHEQPGAGHWWGNECVDWPALMDFLKGHTLASDPLRVDVPISAGGFKDAFRGRAVFVYGTHGEPREGAWALAKARFDSEMFLYRGNATMRIMSDSEFLKEPGCEKINAVFYGNERSNAAWAKIAVTDGLKGKVDGAGLGLLAIVARRDGGPGRVGLVGGTDLAGMRLTTQLPYFVSGVAYPEWYVIGPEALLSGIRGVRGAGWFSDDAGPGAQTR